MSGPPESFEPYAPPVEDGFVARPRVELTTGIKAICIIAIILGALGTMSAVFGAVGLAVGSKMQQLFAPVQMPAENGNARQMQELQEEMQSKMNHLMQRYQLAHAVRIVLHFAIAAALLGGGIATLTGSPRGRVTLRWACGIAIPYELGRAVLDTLVQLENAAIMRPFMEQMFDQGGPAGGQAPPADMMSSVFQVAIYAGLVFSLLLVLAKIIFYLISFIKLRPHQPEPTA